MHDIGARLDDQPAQAPRHGQAHSTVAEQGDRNSCVDNLTDELVLPRKEVRHSIVEAGPIPHWNGLRDQTLGAAETQTFDENENDRAPSHPPLTPPR